MRDTPGQLRGEALFKQVAGYFEAAAPDVIIELDSDHFVNFFYAKVPAFCVGIAEESQGPEEIRVPIARYEMFGVNRDNYLERIRSHMDYGARFELGAMPLQYVPKES